MGLSILAAVEVGGYISILKTVPVLIIVLIWARLLAWTDKDAPAAHLPRESINMAMMGGFILALFLFFALPNFLVSFAALIVVMGGEIAAYLSIRKKKVGLDDLDDQFRNWLASFKGKAKAEKEIPNTVTLMNKSGNAVPAPKAEDPLRKAYDAMQTILYEPLLKGAQQIDAATSGESVATRYYVDGFGYNGTGVDRESGSAAFALIKSTAGLSIEERRKPQTGVVRALVEGKKFELQVNTAGSTAGEHMRLSTDFKTRHNFALDTLGFTDSQLSLMRDTIKDKPGIVLLSAPKGQGLTSLEYTIVRSHDVFLEQVHTVERAPDTELDGITQNKLPTSAPASEESKQVSWIISQEPDVIMLTRIETREAARDLIAFAKERRVYVGFVAASNLDAVGMWRKLVGDDKLAASQLRLAVNGRVLRTLCSACKVGYAPDPNTLRKLNMDGSKVKELYQARTEPIRDQKGNPIPCGFCTDLRFKGRTGVFETIVIDDEVRAVLAAGANPAALKTAFRKQRGKYLQEEALGLVERGQTSVQEVLRVLKATEGGEGGGGDQPARPKTNPPPSKPAAPRPPATATR